MKRRKTFRATNEFVKFTMPAYKRCDWLRMRIINQTYLIWMIPLSRRVRKAIQRLGAVVTR